MFMKNILQLALVCFLVSCASSGPAPVHTGTVVKNFVTQKINKTYQPMLEDTKTSFNFILPISQDAALQSSNTSIAQFCSGAAQVKGYAVGINMEKCERCLHVTFISSDSSAVKESRSTGCFGDQPDCINGQITLFKRTIQMTFTDPLNQAIAHTTHVVSDGKHDSVVKVSHEMCHAAFLEFPKDMSNKEYKIRFPLAR